MKTGENDDGESQKETERKKETSTGNKEIKKKTREKPKMKN
jgi:hypothetical protein